MELAQTNLKIWRESASLILAAKLNLSTSSNFNYKLLSLQRSADSKVLANSYVLPGGNVSRSDSSISWIKHFQKFGYNLDSFREIYPVENIPSIIQNEDTERLPKYLSLRICAIRETFEECGILICRTNKTKHKSQFTEWASYIGGSQIIKWQNKVHDDPYQFFNLCTELNVYPDVWSLHNWSNWVTPLGVPARFNTMFFFSSLNQVPSIHREVKEIQSVKWAVPDEYIEEYQRGRITFAIPQFYEIFRLRNFYSIKSLSRHAKDRSYYGCEKYFPFKIRTMKGIYYIFPGDDLYQVDTEADNKNTAVLDEIPQSAIQNRLLVRGQNIEKLFVNNFVSRDRHLPPKIYET